MNTGTHFHQSLFSKLTDKKCFLYHLQTWDNQFVSTFWHI